MFPTWVDFYFLKTFKRHNTFAKICKSVVLKKVFRLRLRYAVTRGKGGTSICGSRSSSQLRVTSKPTFGPPQLPQPLLSTFIGNSAFFLKIYLKFPKKTQKLPDTAAVGGGIQEEKKALMPAQRICGQKCRQDWQKSLLHGTSCQGHCLLCVFCLIPSFFRQSANNFLYSSLFLSNSRSIFAFIYASE